MKITEPPTGFAVSSIRPEPSAASRAAPAGNQLRARLKLDHVIRGIIMRNAAAKEMSRRSAIIICAALLTFMAALMAEHPSRGDGVSGVQSIGPPGLATVAEKLGLAPLETAPAPSNGRELRIWVSYGSPSGSYLLRLLESNGTVEGRLVAWTWDGAGVRQRELMQPQDWTQVRQELEARSVSTLAAHDSVRTLCISQSIPLIVEALSAGRYTHGEHDVATHEGAEAFAARDPADAEIVRQAASLVDFVHDLASRNGLVAEKVELPKYGCG